MAVRSAPYFEFEGAKKVLGDSLVDVVRNSSYRIAKIKLSSRLGNLVNVEFSSSTQAYHEAVERLEERYMFKVHAPARNKYPVGPAYRELPDTDAEPVVKAFVDVIRDACPVSGGQRDMDEIVRSFRKSKYMIDARALSMVLVCEPPAYSSAQSTLDNFTDIAGVCALSHIFSHAEQGQSIVAKIPRHLGNNICCLQLQQRIELVNKILKLCEKPRSHISYRVEDSLDQNVSHKNVSRLEKVKVLSANLVPSLLLSVRAESLMEAVERMSESDTKWDLFVSAANMQRGLGLSESFKAAYLAYLMEFAEVDDLTDEAFEAAGVILSFQDAFKESMSKSNGMQGMYIRGVGVAIANRGGVVINSGRELVILSRSDLKMCLTLLKETLSTYICFMLEKSVSLADKFYESWCTYHRVLMSLDDADASRAAVAQRDLDLVYKNRLMRDVSRGVVSNDAIMSNSLLEEGGSARPVVFAVAGSLGSDDKTNYEYVRAFRSVVPTWYSPIDTTNETIYCYNLDVTYKQEMLDELEYELKSLIIHSHKQRTGSWPPGIEFNRHKWSVEQDEVAIRTNYAPPQFVADWVPDGDGRNLWDPDAVRVRDKTNITQDIAGMVCPQELNARGPETTREVLYYKGKDASREAAKYMNQIVKDGRLADDAPLSTLKVVLITMKPEQKHNSRVVAMEQCDVRKGNSVLMNNCVPIADVLTGSLLGASARKLEENEKINTSALGENMKAQAALSTKIVNCFAGVDFTKFGHYIGYELQQMVARVISRYYGQPWVIDHMAALKDRVIVCNNAGVFLKFRNVQGADGQGLRNGLWQVMLGAAGSLVFKKMRKECPSLVEDVKLYLSYFMDDHNFLLPLKLPKSSNTVRKVDRFVQHEVSKILVVIEQCYADMGLKAEASKVIVSTQGYGQTGDVYNVSGKIRIAAKGSQSAFTEPASRAPSCLDLINAAMSSADGMLANRCQPDLAYMMSILGAAYHMVGFKVGISAADSLSLGVALSLPRFVGGLGAKTMVDMLVSKGVYSADEALFSSVKHAVAGTEIGLLVRRYITRPSAEFDSFSFCRAPVYRPRGHTPHLTSALEEQLSKHFGDDKDYQLNNLRRHMVEMCSWLVETYEGLPTTVPDAMVKAHPYQAMSTEVSMLTESSTAQSILPDGSIETARRVNWVNFRNYVDWVRRLPLARARHPVINKMTIKEIVARLGWCGEKVDLYGLPRQMLCDMVEPSTQEDHDIRVIPRDLRNGIHSLTAARGIGTYVDIDGKWVTPLIAAHRDSVNLCEAMRLTKPGDASRMYRAFEKVWNCTDMVNLVNTKPDHSPYISIRSLSFVPSVNAQALVTTTSSYSVDMSKLDYKVDQTKKGSDLHCNHLHVAVSTLLHHRASDGNSTYYDAKESCTWLPPPVILRQRIPVALPKVRGVPRVLTMMSRKLESYVAKAMEDRPERIRTLEQSASRLNEMFSSVINSSVRESKKDTVAMDVSIAYTPITDRYGIKEVFDEMLEAATTKRRKPYYCFCGLIAQVIYTKLANLPEHIVPRLLAGQIKGPEGPDDSEVSLMEYITPTKQLVDEVFSSLQDRKLCDSIEAHIREHISKSLKGNHMDYTGDISDMFVKLTEMEFGWWCKVVSSKVSAMPFASVKPGTMAELKSYYNLWAHHYGHQYSCCQAAIKGAKESGKVDIREVTGGVAFGNLHRLFYSHMMWCGYRDLADAMTSGVNAQKALSAFVTGCKKPISRLCMKYHMDRKRIKTINDVIRDYTDNGCPGIAAALTISTGRALEMTKIVCSDLGCANRVLVDITTSPLPVLPKKSVEDLKPISTLSNVQSSKISGSLKSMIDVELYSQYRGGEKVLPQYAPSWWYRQKTMAPEKLYVGSLPRGKRASLDTDEPGPWRRMNIGDVYQETAGKQIAREIQEHPADRMWQRGLPVANATAKLEAMSQAELIDLVKTGNFAAYMSGHKAEVDAEVNSSPGTGSSTGSGSGNASSDDDGSKLSDSSEYSSDSETSGDACGSAGHSSVPKSMPTDDDSASKLPGYNRKLRPDEVPSPITKESVDVDACTYAEPAPVQRKKLDFGSRMMKVADDFGAHDDMI